MAVERALARLRRGILPEWRSTRSCEIERLRTTGGRDEGNAWFKVTLREGRSRQIRRMFELIGNSDDLVTQTASKISEESRLSFSLGLLVLLIMVGLLFAGRMGRQ